MPIPKLWSKLENAGDVTSPQRGTGGVEIGGPSYAAAKFGNGIVCDSAIKGCSFPIAANSINADKGTIELWVKTLFASTGNGPTWHDILYCLSTRVLRLWWQADTKNIYAAFSNGGVQISWDGLTFNVNDLIHMAIAWDRIGTDIGNGKTCALYIDDIEKASSVVTWTTGSLGTNMLVGHRPSSYYADMIIDNIKTYNVVKTDFSDRNTEKGFFYSAPIVASDIKWYRSANWGEGDSHGGNINLSSEIISDELGNIFDDVSDEERTAGITEYRKIYVYLDKEIILFNFKLWVDQSALSPDDEISICVEGVTNEDTQEDAENYEYISPANFGEAVVLGDFEHLNYYPIWIRRIVSPYAMPWHHSTFKLKVGF